AAARCTHRAAPLCAGGRVGEDARARQTRMSAPLEFLKPKGQPTMAPIKQSLSWWCFSKNEPKNFFAEAKKIGYDAIELVGRELWDDVRSAGLVIASHGVGSLTDGLNR